MSIVGTGLIKIVLVSVQKGIGATFARDMSINLLSQQKAA